MQYIPFAFSYQIGYNKNFKRVCMFCSITFHTRRTTPCLAKLHLLNPKRASGLELDDGHLWEHKLTPITAAESSRTKCASLMLKTNGKCKLVKHTDAGLGVYLGLAASLQLLLAQCSALIKWPQWKKYSLKDRTPGLLMLHINPVLQQPRLQTPFCL